MADREPIGPNDRPTGEMTDPRPAQGAAHASHDLFVIAAAADRDADAPARSAAEAQMRDCAECAALFEDLQAISTGLAALPRALPVTRDFRLSPERAASLRRRGWRAAFDSFFRGPSLRPFGSALATLGFAGLLLTVALPGLLNLGALGSGASTTSAPGVRDQSNGGAPVPAAASPASAPAVATSATGKAGGTAAPVDNGAGSGSASQATAAPAGTGAFAYAAPSLTAGVADGADDTANGPTFGPSPAPADPLAFLPWLSLGAFLVGIVLLAIARIGGGRRIGS